MPHCVIPDPAARTAPLDALGEAVFSSVLQANPLRARISSSASYCDSWTEVEPATEAGTFHLIDEGRCRVRSKAIGEPVSLRAGDLIVFPGGSAHTLENDGVEGAAAGSRFTSMLCGEFEFANGRRNAILRALPPWFVVREEDSGRQFRQLAQLMLQEARSASFGSRAVLDKMADTLFVMAVRHHIEHARERRGLIAALGDPRLARALGELHARPGHAWSVATLAETAHMSRTAFATHFAAVLGEGPIEYLTRWRMDEAQRLLAEPSQSVAAVAAKLGYGTEAAFRRAFKRVTGHAPGAVRRRGG